MVSQERHIDCCARVNGTMLVLHWDCARALRIGMDAKACFLAFPPLSRPATASTRLTPVHPGLLLQFSWHLATASSLVGSLMVMTSSWLPFLWVKEDDAGVCSWLGLTTLPSGSSSSSVLLPATQTSTLLICCEAAHNGPYQRLRPFLQL